MEKFSKFNDPSSGVNPFIQPKTRSLTLMNYLKFAFVFPIYLLSYIFPSFLPIIFNIKFFNKQDKKIRVGICNSSSHLDRRIIKLVFGIKNFYYVRDGRYYQFSENNNLVECKKIIKPCFLFPEGTRANNRSVLSYETPTKIDVACFIKYSEVFVYGSYFKYLVSILSNGLSIEVKTDDKKSLGELGGVPTVKFNYKDKENFYNELIKY